MEDCPHRGRSKREKRGKEGGQKGLNSHKKKKRVSSPLQVEGSDMTNRCLHGNALPRAGVKAHGRRKEKKRGTATL